MRLERAQAGIQVVLLLQGLRLLGVLPNSLWPCAPGLRNSIMKIETNVARREEYRKFLSFHVFTFYIQFY